MSHVTVNGKDVMETTIRLPLTGAWVADLSVDTDALKGLEGPVTIDIADGQATLSGTRFAGGGEYGRVDLRVVGGKGRLAKELPSKAYLGVPLRLPLGDILAEAGEVLSPTVDAGILNTLLPHWVRSKGTASRALTVLSAAAGASWRVLSDGTVWVGVESWPASKAKLELLGDYPREGRLELSGEVPSLVPGTTFEGKKIALVEHTILPMSIRTQAFYG